MSDPEPSLSQLLEENRRLRREIESLRTSEARRRQAEHALRESDERHRLLLDLFPDPFIFYDPEGRVRFVNAAFERTYGWTREEWLGRRIDFVPDHEAERTRQATHRVIAGEPVVIETQRTTRDGRLLDVRIRATPVTGPDGTLVGTYVIHRDITEEKRRKRALQETENRYRMLLDASPDPISVYDAGGRVVYVNPAFETTFGWTLEELSGKGIDFVPPHEAERTRDAVARTLAGETVLLDTQRLTKDGRLLDIQLKTCMFTDAEGNLAGDIVIYRDLTARRKAEEELRQTRAQHQLLLDASPDPICVYDAQGRTLYVNPAFEATFGWTLEEVAGRPIDFVPEHEKERTRNAVERTLRGETVLLEAQRLTKDGRLLDVQLKTAVLRDVHGNLAGDIVIYRDVTEEKRRETELDRYRHHLEELVQERTRELREANQRLEREVRDRVRAEQALRESEERHRALFESAPDAVFLVDPETGKVLDVNPAAQRLLGTTREGLLGRPMDEVHPRGEWARLRERLRERARAGRERVPEEARVVRRDGTEIPVEVLEEELRLNSRALSQLVYRDVRERKKLQSQLQHAQRMEAVGTLAGGIAHDFRNILQIVQAQAESLLRLGTGGTSAREGFRRVLRACERGAELTNQLLTFSRRTERELQPVRINEEVREACRMLRRTIPRMIHFRVDLDPAAGLVLADPAQIEQMVVNLALNARDAMPEGGDLVIETRPVRGEQVCREGFEVDPEARFVRIRVSDTGHGMDADTLRHMFDPFFTTKEVGTGTGLGLATVYGIVRAHGGHIACRSRPGEGTTFTIFLPGHREEPEGSDRQESRDDPPPPAAGVCRGTVLLVDDEEEIRDLGRELLETSGFTVITASTGEEALELYRAARGHIDVVILDLGMPGMGGRRCLAELLDVDPDARVLVASGYGQSRLEEEILRAGARAFLSKPYRVSELLEKLRETVREARSG